MSFQSLRRREILVKPMRMTSGRSEYNTAFKELMNIFKSFEGKTRLERTISSADVILVEALNSWMIREMCRNIVQKISVIPTRVKEHSLKLRHNFLT